jgi:ribonuclease III family protein
MLSTGWFDVLRELGLASDRHTPDLVATDANPEQWRQLSPAALAYLGDAVYELYVRHHHIFPPQRVRSSHTRVVAQVRAEMQAHHLQTWLPHLSDRERAVAQRARNAGWRHPKRVDPATYQQATSFEALVGYFYLCDRDRLNQLMTYLDLDCTTVECLE